MVIANHLILFRFKGALSIDKGISLYSKVCAKILWFIELWGVNAGMVGVSIFFVISGYLITALMLKEEAESGTVSLGAFYARRVCRIFPALLLYVCSLGLLDAVGAIKTNPGDALSSSLFLCNTTLVKCGYHFEHLWSLAVEEQFYLFWPLLLIVSGRFRTPLVALVFVIAAIIGVMPSMRIAGWINNGASFACISAGVLYALSPRLRSAFAITQRVPLWIWFVLLVMILPFARIRWDSMDAVVLLALPPTIVAAVLVRSGSLLPYRRAARALGGIGLISYSLYLWQAVFSWDADRYLSPWLAQLSILAVAAAWLSYRFVERPFIDLGRRWSARLRQGRLLGAASPER
jgi:peptidoglycan/LPS O-acetylase OafA/YrhL